jgi:hypothetical protein
MKIIKYLFSLAVGSLLTVFAAQAQNQSGVDSTGLPGDNFSLHGALQLFQDAASPEAFEEAINKEGNHVNNLDLDEDGNTDYVQVISKMDKDAHVFVLQVAVSEKETQDIAVIELEKTGSETAMIQIVGDEDIYGEQIIVEPDSGDDAAAIDFINNSNLSGPNASFEYDAPGVIINVWLWPSVRFVFAPAYRPWVSPWRWHYHPAWWKPWKPYRWNVWHPYRVHHHRSFVVVHTHRAVHAHRVYTPYRSSSTVVRTRHSASVNNYRVTRTKTAVTGPRGNTTTVKKTTVTGPRGNKASKTKVKRHR